MEFCSLGVFCFRGRVDGLLSPKVTLAACANQGTQKCVSRHVCRLDKSWGWGPYVPVESRSLLTLWKRLRGPAAPEVPVRCR